MPILIALLVQSIYAQILVPPAGNAPCNSENNDPISELNYFECNNAGTCTGSSSRASCECCNKADPNNWCYDNDNAWVPYLFAGKKCTTATFKYAITWGWRFETSSGDQNSDLKCDDMETDPPGEGGIGSFTIPSLMNTIKLELDYLGYLGSVYHAACQTCREDNPCQFSNDGDVTEGLTAGFATELNTFYGCEEKFDTSKPDDTCDDNWDLGISAYDNFMTAVGPTGNDMTTLLIAMVTGTAPECDNGPLTGGCFQWENTRPTVYVQNELTSQRKNFKITTESPTPNPTADPTIPPTPTPTVPQRCFKYTNRVLDHKFMGAADNCRGGIKDEWPGGKTCKSPYVICLPEANTPANPDPTEVPNFGQTLPAVDYSLQECAEECAYDQRCLGFELRPVSGTPRGECLLIDDIPLEMENQDDSWPLGSENYKTSGLAEAESIGAGNCCANEMPIPVSAESSEECLDLALGNQEINYYSYVDLTKQCVYCKECVGRDVTKAGQALFSSHEINGRLMLGSPAQYNDLTSSPALCFEKKDYCNPYFEADDLDEEMLECYCPNNRKGTYTKKVKRTIPNTRYCGEDPDGSINERIKQAQANRMFHLCENWCLFETHNPQTESWYWNPWHTCWREQYAGTGTHRSYCNRVIRDPMTIEQQFINRRSDVFCKKDPITNEIIEEITEEPTGQPSVFDSTWYIAEAEDSCDDACEAQGKQCDELTTSSLTTGEESEFLDAYKEATTPSASCTKFTTAKYGWAAPALYQDGTCLYRNETTSYTGCNWAVGVGYQRLCACY